MSSDPGQSRGRPPEYSDGEIVAEIQRLADGDGAPSTAQFDEGSDIHPATVAQRFGTWNNAIEAAGYEPREAVRDEYTEDELLMWIDTFVEMFGCVPTSADLRDWPGPKRATYRNHFGTVSDAIEAAGYEPRGGPK